MLTKKAFAGTVVAALACLAGVFGARLPEARSAGPTTPPVVWNHFDVPALPPTADQVQAHRASSAPAAEKKTSAQRIARVLNPKYFAAETEANLIPLKQWTVPSGYTPRTEKATGNCFLFRREVDQYLLQAEEGVGYVIVAVRRKDGSPLTDKTADLPAYAISAARQWLAPGMQPSGEVHTFAAKFAPDVATWLPRDGVPTDRRELTFGPCRAYCDRFTLRYVVRVYYTHTQRAFAPPEPYWFGEPKIQTKPTRKR